VLMFPKCWVTIFIVSFLYEIYEFVWHRGHDICDILYNILGISLALLVRKTLFSK
jgi:glycopeptide antibiotics resistance protein